MELKKHRQVHGKLGQGEGETPAMETTPSCEATMYGEQKRGTTFDENGPNVTAQGPMEEVHTSRTR